MNYKMIEPDEPLHWLLRSSHLLHIELSMPNRQRRSSTRALSLPHELRNRVLLIILITLITLITLIVVMIKDPTLPVEMRSLTRHVPPRPIQD